MKQYFEAATKIHRFSKTILKRYHEQLVQQISDRLAIELDEEFMLKGNLISRTVESELTLSSILRAFITDACTMQDLTNSLEVLLLKRLLILTKTMKIIKHHLYSSAKF